MPNLDVIYEQVNRMTIGTTGDHEIHYFLTGTLDQCAVVTLNVRRNGVNIASAVTSRAVQANEAFTLSGNVYVNLKEGDVIEMTVTASRCSRLKLNTGVNSSLTLKMLN